MNNKGPRIDPCGTPKVISSNELEPEPIDTNCLRPVRKDLNQSSSLFSTPYFFYFFSKISWSQVSNAFFKSQNIATVWFLLFRESVILFRKWIIGCIVECPPLNPNCHLLKMLFVSRKVKSLIATTFSKNFENALSKEIGL